MWQPEPGWHPLPGGTGPSTLGVWRAAVGDRPVVIKRVAPPTAYDPEALSDPRHFAYWRRGADVATYGLVDDTPGLVGSPTEVTEDAEGITLVTDWVEDAANSGLFVALSLGRFAGAKLGHVRWLARSQLRDRLARVEERGGWRTLARTTAADVAAVLWDRRGRFLDLTDALPQVPQHGDPTPGNLPGRTAEDGEDRLVAIDWSSLGYGPVGGDLGLYLLTAREEFEPLLDAYLLGLPDGLATREQAALGAQVSAVYTAMSRAEWALARVAGGEGALAAKYRHPAVAPHLRALQRQAALVEALLER
ncbi:phosphotransferase [Nocardioides cheoyonin]|uniref:phosphotransferase n=1 Tax=Nocardioides cheoyonin TaxID=3156615 RepID=UPI0032B41EF9